MTIGIMGAMAEEIEPLLENVDSYEKIEHAGNVFYKAKYKNFDLIIVYSKIGKVNSTLSATVLIEKFGIKKLIFSGVAGAINPGLKVGDLIIADKLIQHDVDLTAFGHPWGFIPESGDFVEADEELNTIAKEAALKLDIKLKEGIIATGDQFVANPQKKEFIQKTYQADALEMEGASVAYVCKVYDIPFCIIRSISDSADEEADVSFDEFLKSSAKISAKFVFEMLKLMQA